MPSRITPMRAAVLELLILTSSSQAFLLHGTPHVSPGVEPMATSNSYGGQRATPSHPTTRRCRLAVATASSPPPPPPPLTDAELTQLFTQFDTSGDGFIDLGELTAALAKAGRPVSASEAKAILKQVDTNQDGQISIEEFKAVFSLAPGAVPAAVEPLIGVRSFFLNIGDALGITPQPDAGVAGQWRSTSSGARFVDDVIGEGKPVLPGDTVRLHYTMMLLSTNQVVESSRGGLPIGFEVGEATGAQGWNDAVSGMRVGGKRRVYVRAMGKDEVGGGDGPPTARYDVELLEAEPGEGGAREGVIAAVGGRRAAARLLFALSFVPYFLPDDQKPAFFRDDRYESGGGDGAGYAPLQQTEPEARPKVDAADAYVASSLDALFNQEVLPSSAGNKKKR